MSTHRPSSALRERALSAMLLNALLDRRGAIVLAAAIVLSMLFPNPITGWQPWFWLIGGAVVWLVNAAAVLVNPNTGARVVGEMLRLKFDLSAVNDAESRRRIEKALEYRSQIEAAVARTRQGLLRDNLAETAREIDEWLDNLYSLALRLDAFENDKTIQQDIIAVPNVLQTYEQRLKTVTDDRLRAQMQEIYDAKRTQGESLRNLQDKMSRAKVQMENTLAAMGTVYSQMLLIGVKDIDSGRAQRLREDIAEEIKGLHDVVEAMDEVYQFRG
jgi:hypothetical protein